jgi:catechol 2,3-dioxygenase-like lactoylglutathione lyase family enzyme
MRQVKIVGLLVKDYDATIEFYTRKLGFEVVEDAATDDGSLFRCPATIARLPSSWQKPLTTWRSWASRRVASRFSRWRPPIVSVITKRSRPAGSRFTVSRRRALGARVFFSKTCTATKCS